MPNHRRAFNRWLRWKSKLQPDLRRLLLNPTARRATLFTPYIIRRFTESDINTRVPETLRTEARERLSKAHELIEQLVADKPGLAEIYNASRDES